MLLCKRGYNDKFDPAEQRKLSKRKRIIELLIPKNFKSEDDNDKNIAKWSNRSNQTNYNIFHWLAYWNDTESIFYLLSIIPRTTETYLKIMQAHHSENDQIGNTPIDIAGENQNHEACIILVKYFTEEFEIVENIYQPN